MPLADHQARVDRWIAQFEEGYFDPLTNMVRLSEEVGELASFLCSDRAGFLTGAVIAIDGGMTARLA